MYQTIITLSDSDKYQTVNRSSSFDINQTISYSSDLDITSVIVDHGLNLWWVMWRSRKSQEI
jgi:hypothetical protein